MTADRQKKTPLERAEDHSTENQRRTLEEDLDEIDASGTFIPWEEAKILFTQPAEETAVSLYHEGKEGEKTGMRGRDMPCIGDE